MNIISRHKYPLSIFVIAAVFRLIPVLLTRSMGIGLDDMFQYDMLARSLAAGNGFRWYAAGDLEKLEPYVDFDLSAEDYDPVRGVETTFRAPLYPFFLSIIYRLVSSGENRFFAVRLAQTIVGAALAPLTYYVAKKMLPGNERAARISSWMVALYPLLIVYPLGLGTENPFFLLLLASFLFLLMILDNPSVANYLISGLLLGLTALTRSVILPFAGFAILWIGSILIKWRGALLTLTALILTISPWIIRNSILQHQFTGIETSLGYNLYLGYHPKGNGSFIFGPSLDLMTILNDAERDNVGTKLAMEFISSQPGRFIPLAVNRLGFFWGLEKRVLLYFYGNNILGYIPLPVLSIILLIMLLPFTVISITAALSISLWPKNSKVYLLLILIIAYLLPHIFVLSEDRFHLALVPFLAIMSSRFFTEGIKSIKRGWFESSGRKVLVILSVIAVLLLLTNWASELSRDADKILQILGPNGNTSYFPY